MTRYYLVELDTRPTPDLDVAIKVVIDSILSEDESIRIAEVTDLVAQLQIDALGKTDLAEAVNRLT